MNVVNSGEIPWAKGTLSEAIKTKVSAKLIKFELLVLLAPGIIYGGYLLANHIHAKWVNYKRHMIEEYLADEIAALRVPIAIEKGKVITKGYQDVKIQQTFRAIIYYKNYAEILEEQLGMVHELSGREARKRPSL